MITVTKYCELCHDQFQIQRETPHEIKITLARIKYCPECRALKIKQQKRAERVRREQPTEPSPYGTVAEWNKGFERFWAKRGMKEPHEPFNPPYVEPAPHTTIKSNEESEVFT